MRNLRAAAILFGLLGALAPPARAATLDPLRTATIYVHGYEADGAARSGTFGADLHIPQLDSIAALAGLPAADSGAAVLPRNVVTATTYYGDQAPRWATAADLAELAALDAQWGGGVPRYAAIVAGYARDVLRRSGAERINLVSASFGSLIVRWLIEHDVDGLASEGRIARWLTIEGLIAGNWAASREDLKSYLEVVQPQPIDVDHMAYDWVSANLHAPRTEADHPFYSQILMGTIASTGDHYNQAALSALMRSYDAFQPNDGVQAVADAVFQSVTPRSRYLGLTPPVAFFGSDHLGIKNERGAWASVASFVTQRRRVTVTLTTARVDDLHEPQQPWWDWRPAEVVFQSRAYSPRVASRWGITDPLSRRERSGAAAPLFRFEQDGETRVVSLPVFDGLVLDDETTLRFELEAEEVDYDWRYGVYETAQTPYYDALGSAVVQVSTLAPGTYDFGAGAWSGRLEVTVFDYPLAATTSVSPLTPPPASASLRVSPNPHRGPTRISLAGTAIPGAWRLEIFDTGGRRVRTLAADPAGIVWDGRDAEGRDLPAGVYVHRMIGPAGSWTGRSLLVH